MAKLKCTPPRSQKTKPFPQKDSVTCTSARGDIDEAAKHRLYTQQFSRELLELIHHELHANRVAGDFAEPLACEGYETIYGPKNARYYANVTYMPNSSGRYLFDSSPPDLIRSKIQLHTDTRLLASDRQQLPKGSKESPAQWRMAALACT